MYKLDLNTETAWQHQGSESTGTGGTTDVFVSPDQTCTLISSVSGTQLTSGTLDEFSRGFFSGYAPQFTSQYGGSNNLDDYSYVDTAPNGYFTHVEGTDPVPGRAIIMKTDTVNSLLFIGFDEADPTGYVAVAYLCDPSVPLENIVYSPDYEIFVSKI